MGHGLKQEQPDPSALCTLSHWPPVVVHELVGVQSDLHLVAEQSKPQGRPRAGCHRDGAELKLQHWEGGSMRPGVTSSSGPGPQKPAGPLLTHLQVFIEQALILGELTVLPAPQLLPNLGVSQSCQLPLLPLGLQLPEA